MRNNQPVTQREYPVAENATLMSTTDVNGNIIYANEDFVEVRGTGRQRRGGRISDGKAILPPAAGGGASPGGREGVTWNK